MGFINKKTLKTGIILFSGIILLIIATVIILVTRIRGRILFQVDIHQNKELIQLSNFAEPPQFAIWLQNKETDELKTVFVTHRVAVGDWEGKPNVPVALPQWFRLFRGNGKNKKETADAKKSDLVVTGATPKDDYFSIRVEVKPGSKWICWIEMNLAGDFNEAFPEFDRAAFKEDEFSNGQPALLFKTDIEAVENMKFTPVIDAQSIWDDGDVKIEPVSNGVTTARKVFDNIQISVLRPKLKLIDKNKIPTF
jgi:hypothetical protein